MSRRYPSAHRTIIESDLFAVAVIKSVADVLNHHQHHQLLLFFFSFFVLIIIIALKSSHQHRLKEILSKALLS